MKKLTLYFFNPLQNIKKIINKLSKSKHFILKCGDFFFNIKDILNKVSRKKISAS